MRNCPDCHVPWHECPSCHIRSCPDCGRIHPDDEGPIETENEQLKAWIAEVVTSYHHVLTYGLTQEGVRLVKAEGG